MSEQVLKRCSRGEKCVHPDGPWLPATAGYFSADKRHKDGLQSVCRLCGNTAGRRRYEENPEKYREYSRWYRKHHKEKAYQSKRHWREQHPQEYSEYFRQYNERNRDSKTEYRRSYYRAKSQDIRTRSLAWKRNNPEKVQAQKNRRRARKQNTEGTYTAADIVLVIKAQTNRKGQLICCLCHKPIKDKYHVDHWIPLDKQGANGAGNLRIMHPRCNLSKHNKLPWQLGRLL